MGGTWWGGGYLVGWRGTLPSEGEGYLAGEGYLVGEGVPRGVEGYLVGERVRYLVGWRGTWWGDRRGRYLVGGGRGTWGGYLVGWRGTS
jgi:hypothetical protein